MLKHILVSCLLALGLAAASPSSATLTAVIEVNGHEWLETRAPYLIALTDYYAPHAVFFEGWKSAPRGEIASYEWDFGDGSETFHGFNAAHVYETPGAYTVTLTVTSKAEPGETPETATDTIQITVRARDGTTYYVDSAIGSDAYDGLSATVDGEGAGPWATATKAFGGMTAGAYGQGDQILFKRGQTFELEVSSVNINTHWLSDGGYLFGAYGEGNKPVIKAVEPAAAPDDRFIFANAASGTRFVSFVDLEFDCTPDGGAPCSFWVGTGSGETLLFLRVDVKNFNQGWGLNAGVDNLISNFFIVDSSTCNSETVQFYCIATRVALLNNTFDYSANHIAYARLIVKGVIDGNTFSRPSQGRTALRISGDTLDHMASNVWVSNNKFLGWVDPRAGDRYNFGLIDFCPNVADELRFGEWLVFENNIVADAERFMSLGAWEHVTIRNNHFVSPNVRNTSGEGYIRIGHHMENRPLRDVRIVDNLFEYTGISTDFNNTMLRLYPYAGPPFNGESFHSDIVVARNVYRTSHKKVRFLAIPEDISHYDCLTSEDNIIYWSEAADTLFAQITDPVTYLTLSEWRSLTGNDLATWIYEDFDKPVPGWAESPEVVVDGPIPVAYERVMPMKPESGTARGGGAGSITLAASAPAQDGYYNGKLLKITSGTGAGQAQVIKDYDGSTKVATFYLPWTTVNQLSWVPPDNTSVYEIGGAGAEIAEVALWARYEDGPWTDTGLRTSGSPGSFSYPAAEGAGTYYFATQAIDTAGNVSLPPVGPGATKTYYTGGAPLDTTAPNPGVVSAPASATTSPITVTYTDAADEAGGSGLNEVELWVKKASAGLWNPTGLKQTGSSGSFSYSVSVSGIETFYFDTRAEDNAGNISALPSGDGQASTVFGEVEGDIIPPTAGTVDAPGVTNASPITVSYSGVTDEGGSGLKQVVLWAKVNGGSWLSTGMTNTAAAGSFAYSPAAGDGQYAFALRAEDNAGNLSAAPSGDGVPCLYDATVPTVGSMTSPLYAKGTPIAVSYSDVLDGSGIGLRKVYFWFRKDGGPWVDSGLSQTTASGTFNSSPGGAGTYEYALRVEDIAGNVSAQPSGAGQTTTILDMAAPALDGLTVPPEDSSPPISVVYSGVEDDLSGLKLVYLWFRKGAGAWQTSGLASSAASGSFAFNGMTGNDTYYFALQAEDNAGNLTPVPTGTGTGSTVYDTDFSAGTAASPQYATALPIIVTYSGTTESDNGLKLVRLWYKHGSDGGWTDSGLTSTGLSGQFEFSAMPEDGGYYFALQAENNEGGLTPGPPYGDGDTRTIYDTTPPNPGNMTSPEYTKETPIVITYSGASDAASGLKEVRLWYKKGYAGAWEDTGQRSTTPEGTFTFTDVTGDDAYFFYLQAEDNAGHVSAEPTDELVFGGG